MYVHKLRRRLDEHYAKRKGPPGGTHRNSEGRVPSDARARTSARVAGSLGSGAPSTAASPGTTLTVDSTWALSLVAAAAVGALLTFVSIRDRPPQEVRAARASSIWAPLLSDDLPITIVVGDHYLLGETDPEGESIQRLVREFYINSPEDFVLQVEASPKLMERYRNLNLNYLPTSAAFAIQDIAPIITAKKNVRVMLMSDLTGNMLKATHIVYVGYISGLGMLGDAVFAVSRLSPGGTYDELIDKVDKQQYVSTVAGTGDSRYTDYGYFSTFAGPDRSRVVVIAGTRDTGVMHIAEALTRPQVLDELIARAKNVASFEALYEVHGMGKAGLNGKLLFASATRTEGAWDFER